MPSISFNRFDLGIDLRKGASVSDANRLRQMRNAYVTTGLATAKRPGFVKVADLEPGTKGLYSANGKLNTFSLSDVTHADSRFVANKLTATSEATLKDIWYTDVFNGYFYVVIELSDGTIEHHYLDGSDSTKITDAECPHTKACIKMQSKMFAVGKDGSTVRYSKTGDCKNWSETDDAGFLPTGLNSRGDRVANALGIYKKSLVVFAKDNAQIWTVDPDPTAMALDDIVENVGTSFPRTVASVGGDLYFLGDYGFRSITTLQYTNNLADVDVGSPIDSLVRAALETPDVNPRSFYFYGTGQYVCVMGNHLFVYSISRTSKIAAWSEYFLSFPIEAVAEYNQRLFVRSGDAVYQLDDTASTDDGQQYEMLVELPYMDFKKPGVLKHIRGMDVVFDGSAYVSIGYNANDPDAFTPELLVSGNTRPGGLIPFECVGTEFSIRVRNYDAKPFQLNGITLYYELLDTV